VFFCQRRTGSAVLADGQARRAQVALTDTRIVTSLLKKGIEA
jgi:hypothetical protein